MACFWKGQMKELKKKQAQVSVPPSLELRRDPVLYAQTLIDLNTLTKGMRFNGEVLSKQQLQENFAAVEAYQPSRVREGYLCAFCEPFLCLLSHICKARVIHQYNGHKATYEPKNVESSTELLFQSSTSHFWS